MNIVVTIPKKRQAAIEAEERDLERRLAAGEEGLMYFWAMHHRPTALKLGDRMYFVWDGAVRAWHTVISWGNNMLCQHTGQRYPGFCVLLDPEIHRIPPIAKASFRGYQYFEEPARAAPCKP